MAKYGPAPYPETDRRLAILLSVSNKEAPRLKLLRAAFQAKEGRAPSREELINLVKALAYQAIDAYSQQP